MTIIKRSTLIAVALLAVMVSLMLVRAAQETTIVDESPHIVAGYSYLTQREYRLNPEHPPLIKMLAAVPLLFQNINFPANSTAWTDEVNAQWTLGAQFLHEMGNDAASLTFWARMGPILITLLLGIFLFVWARKLYGALAALFALALFVFSPNFLAHGPYVTTDVGAVFAFFFATFFLFRYLGSQTRLNLVWAGLAFGIAQAMKFSLILLIPYFAVVVILWVIFRDRPLTLFSFYTLKRIFIYLGKLILIGIIGLAVIYPIYQYTILDYSPERQLSDAQEILASSPYPQAARAVVWMSDKPILRSYAQFFMGHLMVFQRVSGGNTVYFLGDVSNTAWWYYFPTVALLKVPFAMLVLLSIATLAIFSQIIRQFKIGLRGFNGLNNKTRKVLRILDEWISKYFIEITLGLFILFYWAVSMVGNLNIGVRHILPTFPFIYLILAGVLHQWIHNGTSLRGLSSLQMVGAVIRGLFKRWLKGVIIILLLLWYIMSSLSVFPHSLAYFNELAGGPGNGYKFVVDSNLDWGQDLRGLAEYVNENNIDKIKIDYFGGGNPRYYLGDKYEQLDPNNETQRNGWIAVSATLLQGGRGRATKGFKGSTTHYMWLNDYEPVAKIGYSIFVYYIK